MSDVDDETGPYCAACGSEGFVCGNCAAKELRLSEDAEKRWREEFNGAVAQAVEQADRVSRLSAEVDRLRAERDEQVRVNGFLVGRGKEQDIIRDRLSAEVAEANATIVRREREHQDGLKRLGELFERYKVASHEADRRLEGERDGLREVLAPLGTAPNGTHCGTCRAPITTCDAMDDGCHGHIARRALSTPTGTRAGEACGAFQPYPNAVAKSRALAPGTPTEEET